MRYQRFKQFFTLILIGSLVACASTPGSFSDSGSAAPKRLAYYLEQPEIKQAVDIDSEGLLYQYLLAEIAIQNGQYTASIESLLEVAEHVDDPQVAERAARVAIYTKNYEQGLIAILRWIELEPENFSAHQMAAVLFIHLEELDKALVHLEQILALSGQEGFMVIANVLGAGKDEKRALEVMKTLTDSHQTNPYALFAYGGLAAQFERYDAAKHLLSAAMVLQPDMTEAIIARARAMTKLGETDQAIKDLAKAVKHYPDVEELTIAYGRMLISAKRYEEATSVFKVILVEAPDDDEILYTLALLTLDLERYADAKKYFNRLLLLNRRTDEAHYYLGRIAENKQQYKNAIKFYTRVVKGNYQLDAQFRIASMHGKLGETDEARSHAQGLRGMYTEPGIIVRTYLIESDVLNQQQDYQAAFDVLTTGLVQFPQNIELLYSRSLIAEKLNQLTLLEKDLRFILSKEPNNADALNALGYTLADRTDRLDEAYALIDQAMKLKPGDPAVTDSYGWVLYQMGRYDEAVNYLKQALSMQYDAEIAAHLGEVLWVSGDQSAATQVWQQALDKIPQHEAVLRVIRRFKE